MWEHAIWYVMGASAFWEDTLGKLMITTTPVDRQLV